MVDNYLLSVNLIFFSTDALIYNFTLILARVCMYYAAILNDEMG